MLTVEKVRLPLWGKGSHIATAQEARSKQPNRSGRSATQYCSMIRTGTPETRPRDPVAQKKISQPGVMGHLIVITTIQQLEYATLLQVPSQIIWTANGEV